jgi:hypothetical protein
VEEVLRSHRDNAMKLLKENKAQSREGIELLVKNRLGRIIEAANPEGNLTQAQLEQLHQEILDLSYITFSLGYTVANLKA